MVKLAEIAEASGFSIPVVSRVLNPGINSTAKVAQDTRKKILETARRLGYRPNRTAEFLKRGRVPTIGVFLPHYRNSLITDLVMGISMAATEHGFPVSFEFDTKYANYRQFLEDTRGQCNCGLISYPDFKLDVEAEKLIYRYLIEGGKMVLISAGDFMQNIPHIDIDNKEGGRIAARALMAASCQRIVLFNSSTLSRAEGFREELGKSGIIPDEFTEWDNEFDALIDYCKLHRKDNVGIFVSADRAAVQIHTMLLRVGILPGKDVNLIGYDNLFLTEHLAPSLTTIAQPFVQVGKCAIDTLVASIYGKTVQNVMLTPELIVRQTLSSFK